MNIKNSSPRVSVIIPTYNAGSYLEIAVQSAVSQDLTDIEIIIINDGSTDNSGNTSDHLAQRYPAKVRVIHQANGGLCAARNAGIAAARGEYVALLDSDDEWLAHHLRDSVAVLDAQPEVGLVHANIEWMDAEGQGHGTPSNRWSHGSLSAWRQIYLREEHVSCPTAVFRRRLADQVGGFDMSFNRLGCEDRDLWLQIAAISKLVYLNAVHARYRRHGGNMSKQKDKMTEARLRLVNKHGSSPIGRPLWGKALNAVYVDLTHELRADGLFGPAVKAGVQAIRYAPTSVRSWKVAVGALLRRH